MTSTDLKRERATPLSPDDRRVAIVEAVVPLLAAQGPSVTTRQIAEAAGVAEGTLFRVFPDKKALLVAVAEHLVDPDRGQQAILDALGSATDLESKVIATIAHLRDRMHHVTMVIMALHHSVIAEGSSGFRDNPPTFLTEANRRLVDAIATHVFAPHADRLRITPAQAALVLRAQVFGMWHPGMGVEAPMTVEELATVLIEGLSR